jgi:hypothetical protein
MNLGTYSKEFSVAGLLGLWFLMDVLGVKDQTLQYTIMGLVGVITGYGGVKNLQPGSTAAPAAARPPQ